MLIRWVIKDRWGRGQRQPMIDNRGCTQDLICRKEMDDVRGVPSVEFMYQFRAPSIILSYPAQMACPKTGTRFDS
jgi:hypothetical protein